MILEISRMASGMISGEKSILNPTKPIMMMPYRRSRMRRRTSAPSRPRVQHTPTEVDGTIATKALSLRFLVIPNVVAGSSLLTERSGGDRSQEVQNGSSVGNITLNVSIRGITAAGTLEIALVKLCRQSATPVLGTSPIPTSADTNTTGLQAIMRGNTPGWVFHYSVTSFAAEQPQNKWIKLNLGKFRMSKWRDGDFLALMLFNRSNASITVDHTGRYYEYK